MSKNIVLIGFMGSGKSSVGKALAKKSGIYFIDSDDLIETKEGLKIKKIFKKYGEKHFRKLEREFCLWAEESLRNCVISTGGGMPIFYEDIKSLGDVIFIDTPFEIIYSRLKKSEIEKRPLFKDYDGAKKIFEEREKIYKKCADFSIDGSKSIEETVEAITAIMES